MSNIVSNLEIIQDRIKNTCLKIGRNPLEVQLLLATKTVPADRIRVALETGLTLVGENKIQELKTKHADLVDLGTRFHFIGHLQTNKIKEVLRYADCIESVDRNDLVQKLDQRLRYEERKIDVLLQVNTSYEESKFGVDPQQILEFAKEVSKYDTLRVKGLMTIGLLSSESEKVRECFQLLKTIQEQIKELNLPNFEMKELSMGMSNDFEIAIEEGATIVRVGTSIFGDRIYPDSYYWNENVTIT
ncbi:YggS family pyridoxal phosphate-dependent enzyme [Flavobacterium sp. '19STA2R22 D10 B1']|uniref:YggS family pyridoxal phosphate-dependent enzyme n=1 Tax=Flavobacterium aerium TaxID=3037261 RepID=UPI00278BF180|nr:YggS family pyridoxal phosphate-dependent enzyme [Flavobacterium sp. '19STA2R22 D10 B1']